MAGRIAYYGNIVKDGLVLCLDAAKKDSYPGSGTTWRDVSGNGVSFTLGGVTYNPANFGAFEWDQLSDNVTCNSGMSFLTYSAATVCFWMRTTDTRFVVLGRGTGGPYLGAVNGGNWYHTGVGGPTAYTNGVSAVKPVSDDSWKYYTFTNCNFADPTYPGAWSTFNLVIFYYTSWEFNPGATSMFKIYNRNLSVSDILQNYNATKGRYGL